MTGGASGNAIEELLSPDMRLAAAYSKASIRPAVVALFALDRTLGMAVSQASQPISGQLRLAWWRDLLGSDAAPVAGSHPVVKAIAPLTRNDQLRGAMTAMVNGWERLFEDDALAGYAEGRGHGLFEAIGAVHEVPVPYDAGRAWALTDLAFHSSDRALAERALTLARGFAPSGKVPRPLAILDCFAQRDAARGLERGSAESTPSRLWDALRGALAGA